MPTKPMSNGDLVDAVKAGRSDVEIFEDYGLPLPVIRDRRSMLERHGWVPSADPPLSAEARARAHQDLFDHHVPLVNASDLFFHFARASGVSHAEMEELRQHLLECYRLVGRDPYAYLG